MQIHLLRIYQKLVTFGLVSHEPLEDHGLFQYTLNYLINQFPRIREYLEGHGREHVTFILFTQVFVFRFGSFTIGRDR